jgi:hypothetical protein
MHSTTSVTSQWSRDVETAGERSGASLHAEEPELDAEAQGQLDAFHQYLASLEVEERMDQVQPPERLLRLSEIDNLARWHITLRPVRNLRAAARFRAVLAHLPLCVAARAREISGSELHFTLTTVHLSPDEVSARVAAALRTADCPGTVEIERRH